MPKVILSAIPYNTSSEIVPKSRNFLLTLKNSPYLNKYNFEFINDELLLFKYNKYINKISLNQNHNFEILSKELMNREKLITKIPYFIQNKTFPFFDTSPYNSISLINLESVEDFDFVLDLSAGVPGNAEWVQYACDPKNVPLSSGCTSIMVTDAIPYVESGQLRGILAGMPGAAEYEDLVYNFMINQNNNKYILDDSKIYPGKATSRMSAQSLAHVVMVIFIVFGNISYYLKRKRKD